MHKKMPCFKPQKTPLTNQIHMEKGVEGLCDPLDGNNSIVENLHIIIMPKCANHTRLATLHLEYVKCLIFLTT